MNSSHLVTTRLGGEATNLQGEPIRVRILELAELHILAEKRIQGSALIDRPETCITVRKH